jgi:hypothetical protein
MMSLDLFIKEWKIEFALGDIANGSQKIRQVTEHKTFFISSVNHGIVRTEKMPMAGLFHSF